MSTDDQIKIRPATLDDVPIMAQFSSNIASETEDLVLDLDVVKAGIISLLNDKSKGHYYVAEIDGEVAGQTMITYEHSDWKNGTIWWIQSVYTDKKFRRRGVFRSLYNHVLKQATSERAVAVKLYAFNTNKDAHAVYESLGMVTHNIVYEKALS